MPGRKIDRRTFLKIAGVAAAGAAVGGGIAAHVASDEDSLLLGVWRYLVPIPRPVWQSQVSGDTELDFMSEAHHRVRDLSVLEIPRVGEPLMPEFIAQELSLSLPQVVSILDDLEAHMTFLFRNEQGAVTWAYPVTVDQTPHRVTFSSGEQVYAAWAIDAIATPFVQGQLRGENLSFTIETSCAHCGELIHIEMDGDLNYRVVEEGAAPLIHVPMVDLEKLDDPSIIDAFWRKSVFFWSEEHAREYRRETGGEQGLYMTMNQAVYVTPITQGALFGIPPYGERGG